MSEKSNPSNKYQKIDPDEFENYEEQFIGKGGGGKSSGSGKGKKTLKAIKSQVKRGSDQSRKNALEEKLGRILKPNPVRDDEAYLEWINQNLSG